MTADKLNEFKNRLLRSALFKDSFWALTGNVFGKGLALLASIVVARYLGKDLFGMYGLIRTTLLSIAVFSTFGLGYTATKFIAEYIEKSPQRVKSIILDITHITLITAILFALLIFVFSRQLASYLDSADLYSSIRYLAVIVIFNSITTTQTGILAGFKRFKQLARINLINGVVTFTLSIVLTYFYSLNGALIALLISQGYNCLQNYLEVNRSVVSLGVQHETGSIKKELARFSLPVAIQEMLDSIVCWVFPVLLVKFSTMGDVGLYNAALQWSSVILFIPGSLRNVLFSHLSSLSENESAQRLIMQRMLFVSFIATFIPFLVVKIFSGAIVDAYGATFVSLQAVLNISVFTTTFTCMSSIFLQHLISSNRVWCSFSLRTLTYLLTICLFVSISYLGYFESGAITLAVSVLLSQVSLFLFFAITFIGKLHRT